MSSKNTTRISKFLSLVLRHEPHLIGLKLDPQGWADVNDLLKKSTVPISREELEEVVAANDKKRFAFSEDGKRIRASQGHSLKIDLGLPPVEPPVVLYHGTATRFMSDIMKEGLTPQSRQYVHLSDTFETAVKVGQRHGRPVILPVDAKSMHDKGMKFYISDNGVWLTETVPVEFIKVAMYPP